jgi:hypothetical protein
MVPRHSKGGPFATPHKSEAAQSIAARGLLLMANRHFEDRVELVVRPKGEDSGLT